MESSSFEDVNRLVRSELYEHMDPEFGKYLAMNLPGCGNIIGVRLDDLKEIARQIADINWKEYLKHAPDDTLEDVVIQGLVLGFAQGKLEEILAYADEFVPKIDNWWVCDSFCSTFVAASMYPEIVWEFIMKYMGDSELNPAWRKKEEAEIPEGQGGIAVGTWQDMSDDFRLRFVAIMLKCYFVNDKYIDKCLYAFEHMQDGGYYAKDGVAFGLAESYFVFPDKTIEYIKGAQFDRQILEIISQNARIPFKDVAAECGVSRAAIHQRVQRLIDLGVIVGSGYHVNPKSLGYRTCTYVGIKLEKGSMYKAVVAELQKIPEIVECHFTTGPYTMLTKVYARDNEHLMDLLNNKMQEIPGVTATETLISLEQSIKKEIPIRVEK